jgi:hypothetical protein
MHGYSLKLRYLVFVFFMLVIVTLELCLCSVGASTSYYLLVEGQCFVNIEGWMLGICTMSGTVVSRQCVRCQVQLSVGNVRFRHIKGVPLWQK